MGFLSAYFIRKCTLKAIDGTWHALHTGMKSNMKEQAFTIWPLWQPHEAATSTSATSIEYQTLAKDLRFYRCKILFVALE